MSSKSVLETQSWEEFASCLPRTAHDTVRLMAAVFYRFEREEQDTTDTVVIADEYFRRARWPRPSNLTATANHCAGKGWLAEAGQTDRKKIWRLTRKGHDFIAPMFEL